MIYKIFLYGMMLCLLSSCSILSDLENTLTNAQGTAQAVETGIQRGLDLVHTGEAVVDQVESNSVFQTAQAVTTRFSDSGLIETAQSAGGEELPKLLGTVQYLATEYGPGLQETFKAAATRIPTPSDIPIIKGEKFNLNITDNLVAFAVKTSFAEALNYYETEMPVMGWQKIESGSNISAESAVLVYQKPERKAILTIKNDRTSNITFININLQEE